MTYDELLQQYIAAGGALPALEAGLMLIASSVESR